MESTNSTTKGAVKNTDLPIFSSSVQVISALSSKERSQLLIQWLKGAPVLADGVDFEKVQQRSNSVSSQKEEGQQSKCIHRVSAAYCILNAIRDGCRGFLEQEPFQANQVRIAKGKKSESANIAPKYEESFPSLSSKSQTQVPNILKPKKKTKRTIQLTNLSSRTSQPTGILEGASKTVQNINIKTKKVKRRIRPAPVAPSQQKPWGNIASLQNDLPSTNSWSKAQRNSLQSLQFVTTKDPMTRAMSDMYTASPKVDNNKMTSKPMNTTKVKVTEDPMNRVMNDRESESDNSVPMIVRSESPSIFCLKQPHKTPSQPMSSESLEILRDNTINVYYTIIISQLAPSTVLEIQLMVRMVSLYEEGCGNDKKEGQNQSSLKNLFTNSNSCRLFSVKVLQKLENLIINFDRDILLSLLGIKAFVEQLPNLTQSIQNSLESQHNAMLSGGKYTEGGGSTSLVASGMSTILTMPFQEQRDSRHNYRSRDQTSMYNNREQCRDAFLFQLRAFQQMRGTVLDPTQVHQSLNMITLALDQMMKQLLSCNVPWFAELFTDLLLQIGLVPMQELDEDILKNVADKNRLQKLHSRFTSKVAQKNKSSKALTLHATSSGPAPDEFFTEHQEFFYLFISSVDSYCFCTHLRRRLIHLLLKLSSAQEDRGLERRISEMRMLSKFLGLLVFSPNWNVSARDLVEETVTQHFTPIIPINNIIKDAYKEGTLIPCIPWVLDFLRMMSWDSISKQIPYYKETFCILRCIQRQVAGQIFGGHILLGTNLLSMMLYLEAFFVDVIGLVEVEHFDNYKLPKMVVGGHKSLNFLCFRFNSKFVVSSSSHLDDLNQLAADLARNGRIVTGSGASKKLKPHILSTNPTSYVPGSGLTAKDRFGPLNVLDQSKLHGFLSKNIAAERIHGPGKLVDAFFHQHKHLQFLCEFLIDYSIDHVLSKRCLEECITPTLTSIAIERTSNQTTPSPLDLDWYLQTLESIEKDTINRIFHYTRKVLQKYITASMETLVPSYVDPTVKKIASDLCFDHALRKGKVLVSSLLRTEAKKAIDAQLHLKNKVQRDSSSTVRYKAVAFSENLIQTIGEITSSPINIMSGESHHTREFIEKIKDATNKLSPYIKSKLIIDCKTMSVVILLIQSLTKFVATWIQSTQKDETIGLYGLTDIIHLVARIGQMDFASEHVLTFGSLISNPNCGLSIIVHRSKKLDLKQFQDHCIGGNLMKKEDLLNGLFDLLENHPLTQVAAELTIQLVNSLRDPKHDQNHIIHL